MKKLILLLALTFTTSMVLTSCREKSGIEKAADDVEDAVEDVAD
jgi:predicted small secreted protein